MEFGRVVRMSDSRASCLKTGIGLTNALAGNVNHLQSTTRFKEAGRSSKTSACIQMYKAAGDWVFASPYSGGRKPYWFQSLMRNRIREVARRLGITKKIGWHTFRHTCATLLRASGADIKVVQELLRHASCRVTLDTYTQAVTEQKRAAQNRVASLVRGLKPNWALRPHRGRMSGKIRRRFDRNLKQSTG
jgi:integrase